MSTDTDELRDLAEMHLYDGDLDRPIPAYEALYQAVHNAASMIVSLRERLAVLTRPGMCGDPAPKVRLPNECDGGMRHCTLLAGHLGWHHDDVSGGGDWKHAGEDSWIRAEAAESRLAQLAADLVALRGQDRRTAWELSGYTLIDAVLKLAAAESRLAHVRELADELFALHEQNPGTINVCLHCNCAWPCPTEKIRIRAALDGPTTPTELNDAQKVVVLEAVVREHRAAYDQKIEDFRHETLRTSRMMAVCRELLARLDAKPEPRREEERVRSEGMRMVAEEVLRVAAIQVLRAPTTPDSAEQEFDVNEALAAVQAADYDYVASRPATPTPTDEETP